MNGWRTDKPKKDGKYLVTVRFTDISLVGTMWYGELPFAIEQTSGKHWYDHGSDGMDFLYDDDVIAWQELPEPYKEGEE